MTLFIHIGLQKTGTTALQKCLSANEEHLKHQGLLYCDRTIGLDVRKGASAHHFIPHALENKRRGYTPDAPFSKLGDHIRELRKQAGDFKGHSLISSEDFSTLNEEQIMSLRQRFGSHNIKIIIVFRRQDYWLDSLIGHLMKVGRDIDIDSFIASNAHMMNYKAVCDRWAAAFGEDAIIVDTYENSDVWETLNRCMGYETAKTLQEPLPVANKSLSVQSTKFLQLLRGHTSTAGLRKALEEVEIDIAAVPKLKYLSVDAADRIMQEYGPVNAEIAQKYFSRSRLFKDQETAIAADVAPITTEEIFITLAKVVEVLAERKTN